MLPMLGRRFFTFSLALVLSAAPAALALADTEVTSSNESEDVEAKTGDATATNSGSGHVGHQGPGESTVTSSDIDSTDATNVQEGDNDLEANQTANARTGSGITGQVVAAQADGLLEIDATNLTLDSMVTTGDATSENDFAAFVGLNAASQTTIAAADVASESATNVQEGDNAGDVGQIANADTGDAISGQIVVGSSTGSSVITVANTSEDADATSGDSDQGSDSELFTGLLATGIVEI
jgi:hypothetical protein